MSINANRKYASLSLDLDNLWSYLKIHGDPDWQSYPSYFEIFIPRILEFLNTHQVKTTFFIVGQDADREETKPWLRKISREGHEFGNHSYYHEPWMEERTTEEIRQELVNSHNAIEAVTGKTPVGFRGPGFCCNNNLLEAVQKLEYTFDASLFPTVISPLAKLYYLLTTTSLKSKEKSKRKNLFGKMRNGFMSLKPFKWNLKSGPLLEIPVTTIPLVRLPFHFSYIMWLSKFSKSGALRYFSTALTLCKTFNVEPSVLLHPLDFLGKEDVTELNFFPGMDLTRDHKLEIAHEAISILMSKFEIITMSQHAEMILKKDRECGV